MSRAPRRAPVLAVMVSTLVLLVAPSAVPRAAKLPAPIPIQFLPGEYQNARDDRDVTAAVWSTGTKVHVSMGRRDVGSCVDRTGRRWRLNKDIAPGMGVNIDNVRIASDGSFRARRRQKTGGDEFRESVSGKLLDNGTRMTVTADAYSYFTRRGRGGAYPISCRGRFTLRLYLVFALGYHRGQTAQGRPVTATAKGADVMVRTSMLLTCPNGEKTIGLEFSALPKLHHSFNTRRRYKWLTESGAFHRYVAGRLAYEVSVSGTTKGNTITGTITPVAFDECEPKSIPFSATWYAPPGAPGWYREAGTGE